MNGRDERLRKGREARVVMYEELMGSPEFGDMPGERQEAIRQAHAALMQELNGRPLGTAQELYVRTVTDRDWAAIEAHLSEVLRYAGYLTKVTTSDRDMTRAATFAAEMQRSADEILIRLHTLRVVSEVVEAFTREPEQP